MLETGRSGRRLAHRAREQRRDGAQTIADDDRDAANDFAETDEIGQGGRARQFEAAQRSPATADGSGQLAEAADDEQDREQDARR